MKIINYFSKDIVDWGIKKIKDKYIEEEKEIKEPIFKILPKEYKINDQEFEYWLDIIQKTYGQYGEITTENIPDELTEEEKKIKQLENEITVLQNAIIEQQYKNTMEGVI